MTQPSFIGPSKADSAFSAQDATATSPGKSNIVEARGKRRFTLLAWTPAITAGVGDAITLKGSNTGNDDDFGLDLEVLVHKSVENIIGVQLNSGPHAAAIVLTSVISSNPVEAPCPTRFVRAELTVTDDMPGICLQLEAHD
jgi:hypothetical protein